jgi:hypothetical protein
VYKLNIFVFILLHSLSSGQQSGTNQTLSPNKFIFRNSIETELFGHGLFYSIGYERLIFNTEKLKTLGQMGFAYYPKTAGIIPLWIPLSINQLLSFNSHHIEAGIGQVLINDEMPDWKDNFRFFGSFKIGYRYQNPPGRILVKIAFTPVIDYGRERIGGKTFYNPEFHPLGGLTFGYNF